MLIVRLLVGLLILLLILSGGMYIFTRDQRYINFAWQAIRFAVFLLLVFGFLYILERYVLIGWKVLL